MYKTKYFPMKLDETRWAKLTRLSGDGDLSRAEVMRRLIDLTDWPEVKRLIIHSLEVQPDETQSV